MDWGCGMPNYRLGVNEKLIVNKNQELIFLHWIWNLNKSRGSILFIFILIVRKSMPALLVIVVVLIIVITLAMQQHNKQK